MSTWWQHLTWPHAALVLLCIVIALVLLLQVLAARLRSASAAAPPARISTPYVVDYSAARQKQIEWLGDRWLFAKPINRRTAGAGRAADSREKTPGPSDRRPTAALKRPALS